MTEFVRQLMTAADAARLCRGEVVEVTESGTIVVELGGEAGRVRGDLLVTNEAPPPTLVPGDIVLTWQPRDGGVAVVLGRIGPSRGLTPDHRPDTLTIEARETLTLRVGDGSITIRADGKVLIKGRDLVSHAQRMNRIKGGAVAIN